MTTQEIAQEALGRARSGLSFANYRTVLEEFAAKGIPMDDILPRENVLTFHAWKALGRRVRKGEHGVRVATVRKDRKEDKETGEVSYRSRPWSAVVFHVTQTESE